MYTGTALQGTDNDRPQQPPPDVQRAIVAKSRREGITLTEAATQLLQCAINLATQSQASALFLPVIIPGELGRRFRRVTRELENTRRLQPFLNKTPAAIRP